MKQVPTGRHQRTKPERSAQLEDLDADFHQLQLPRRSRGQPVPSEFIWLPLRPDQRSLWDQQHRGELSSHATTSSVQNQGIQRHLLPFCYQRLRPRFSTRTLVRTSICFTLCTVLDFLLISVFRITGKDGGCRGEILGHGMRERILIHWYRSHPSKV